MGYSPKPGDVSRPVVSMSLEKVPSLPENRAKLAKVVVDLVLYDLELVTLKECVIGHNKKYRDNPCTIIDALEARRNTTGGTQEALAYLYNSMRKKSTDALDPVNSAKDQRSHKYDYPPVDKLKPSRPVISSNASGSDGYYTPSGSASQWEPEKGNQNAKPSFPRTDPRDLPPPDLEDNNPSVDFVSTIPHINPSSEYDDEQLIPGSTHLGYRNPPKTNSNPLAGGGPTADPTGEYEPAYTPPVIASTNYHSPAARSRERDRLGHPSGVSQYSQYPPPYGAQDGFRPDGTRQGYLRSTSHGSGEGLHSLPTSSVRSTAGNNRIGDFQSIDNQLGPTGKMSSSKSYGKQKSMPASPDTSYVTVSFTTSSTANTMATGTTAKTAIPVTYNNVPGVSTTFGDQSITVDTTAVVFGNVPMGEPVTTARDTVTMTTTTKFGKLDLNKLKREREEKKTANLHIQVTDRNDDQHPQHNLRDLSTMRNYLDRKKDVRTKVEGINGSDIAKAQPTTYVNFEEIASARPTAAAAKIDIPVGKGPVATPRANKEFVEKKIVEYWQCACCETVNEVKRPNCKKCTVNRGEYSVSHAYCGLCNLVVYISEERMYKSAATCSMCKEMLHSAV